MANESSDKKMAKRELKSRTSNKNNVHWRMIKVDTDKKVANIGN